MNKYTTLFGEDMNSGELRTVLFTVAPKLDNEIEKKELFAAYQTISDKVFEKEMKEAAEQGVMTSY